MKNAVSQENNTKLLALSFALVGICIFLGVVVSFRSAGGTFAGAAELVRTVSFDGAVFSDSFASAALGDLAYCIVILVFAAGFPISVLPGGLVLAKGFFLGVAAGLAARCCVMKEAAGILFAIFISNVLVLPLYILLYSVSVRYSVRTCALSPRERVSAYFGFLLKVLVFFALMCLCQAVQIGIGILVL